MVRNRQGTCPAICCLVLGRLWRSSHKVPRNTLHILHDICYTFFYIIVFFLPYRFTGFGHSIIFRQTWRGSCTCDSNQEITSSVSMISGWWCLKLVFGLILLSFLLSFCYRFVSRTFSQSMSVGHTTTWSVHAMLEAYQQLHFHSEIARNTMQWVTWYNVIEIYIFYYTLGYFFFLPYRFTVNGLHPWQRGTLQY